jgi:hypothetical protein
VFFYVLAKSFSVKKFLKNKFTTKPFPACEKIISHSPLALRSEISRKLIHLENSTSI